MVFGSTQMIGSTRAVVAALLLGLSAPVAAQTGAPAAAAPAAKIPKDMEAVLAWLGRMGEAMNVHASAMRRFAEAQPLLETMTTPAGIKAGAPRLRAIVAEARGEIARADRMLGELPRVEAPAGVPFSPAGLVAEGRAQNARGLALLDDFTAFLAAAERGDHNAARRAAPKLLEGSFLMLDGTGFILRTRRAAIPANQSIHQALTVGIQLYRAMGASGRAWLAARFEGKAGPAAAHLRTELLAAAAELRSAGAAGKVSVDRELAELEARGRRAGFDASERTLFDRFVRAAAEKKKYFALADELATLAEAGAGTTGSALAAQRTPELMGRLAGFEARYHAIAASGASLAAGTAR
jgi:hypothetical protein